MNTLGLFRIRSRSTYGRILMESSPPMVEMTPSIVGSANAAIRSSARARGFLDSHSGSRKACSVSITDTPNSSSNWRLPAA